MCATLLQQSLHHKNILILFYPNPKGEYNCLPYPLLYLERALKDINIKVVIIDERFDNNLLGFVDAHKDAIIAVGFSVILGYQVVSTVDYSQKIKSKYPDIPIIWGGAFVNWAPQTCIAEDYIDYIITGQGEYVLKELVANLISDSDMVLSEIAGLGFKKEGRVSVNRLQHYFNPFLLPEINYNLIDLQHYVENGSLHYIASVGCSHFCNFCFVSQTWKGRCFSNSAENIIRDIKYFLSKEPSIKYLALDDTNFFTHKETVFDFCKKLNENNINLNWCGTTRISEFLQLYDENDLKKLRIAGCDTIYAGAESGDEKVLKALNKKLTVKEIILFNERVSQAGIKPSLSFMVLFPDAPMADLKKTLQLIMQLKYDAPQMVFTMNAYIPMRKNIYYFKALKLDYKFPRQMAAIVDGINKSFEMPWHNKEQFRILNQFSEYYFRFSNPVYYKEMPKQQRWFYSIINKTAYPFIRYRFKHNSLRFRIDAVIFLFFINIFEFFFKAPNKTNQKNYMTPRAKNF